MESEFEDYVAEMFLHANKKIKRTLKIKDDKETNYIKMQVEQQNNEITNDNGINR